MIISGLGIDGECLAESSNCWSKGQEEDYTVFICSHSGPRVHDIAHVFAVREVTTHVFWRLHSPCSSHSHRGKEKNESVQQQSMRLSLTKVVLITVLIFSLDHVITSSEHVRAGRSHFLSSPRCPSTWYERATG